MLMRIINFLYKQSTDANRKEYTYILTFSDTYLYKKTWMYLTDTIEWKLL